MSVFQSFQFSSIPFSNFLSCLLGSVSKSRLLFLRLLQSLFVRRIKALLTVQQNFVSLAVLE
jgi:hypothetical protein